MKKQTGIIIGSVVAGLLAIGLITNFVLDESRVETKTIGTSAYQVAALDVTTGKLDKDETGKIISDLITVDGLTIEVSDDADVSYVLHYFDDDKTYMSTSDSYTGDFTGTVADGAEYVRIEISPDADEDGEVSVFELPGYVGQLEVTVNK